MGAVVSQTNPVASWPSLAPHQKMKLVFLLLALMPYALAQPTNCAGCFQEVSSDWKSDEGLKKVVTGSFELLKTFVNEKALLGDKGSSGQLTLLDVVNLKSQVVAGKNYQMDITLSYSNANDPEVDGRKLVCKNVKVFVPLPFNCTPASENHEYDCVSLSKNSDIDCQTAE